MEVAVVAYPSLSADDSRWIESFRARFDPAAHRIDAHFTLVFPVESQVRELEERLATVSSSAAPIDFCVDAVEVFAEGGTSWVFLVPGEGAAEIASLHERLGFARMTRDVSRVPAFVPHITVGKHPKESDAEEQVSAMQRQWRSVRGRIGELELVRTDQPGVSRIARYPLGEGVAQGQPDNGVKRTGAPRELE